MTEIWNQKEPDEIFCPECGSDTIESTLERSGKFEWWEHKCTTCGYEFSEEPDWDILNK